jgi:protein SCO1/2
VTRYGLAVVRGLTLILIALSVVVGCDKAPKLQEYGQVPAFSLVDQAGKAASAETFRGQVWAAAFMFTRCPTICPTLTRAMRGVQQDAQARGVPLHLVSFSVDPDNDTPAVLRDYAARFGADLASWSFLTGDYNVVKTTAEQGFKMALSGKADPERDGFGITHGSHLVLVDRNLVIRGFYRTSEPAAMKQIVTDAARLAD